MTQNRIKWQDRLWLRANKKPSSKRSFYAGFIISWILMGFFITLAIAMIIGGITPLLSSTSTTKTPLAYWIITAIVVVYTAVFVVISVRKDTGRGYANALYERYLQRREERIARLTQVQMQAQSKKEVYESKG